MKPVPNINKNPKTDEDWFGALLELARFLRSPEGCPWDRKQTMQSFAHFLAEETEELKEAIERHDTGHIVEEFGDTFFCALMLAVVAEDTGVFRLRDAFEKAHEKMVRRHEHVFGDQIAETPDEAVQSWEQVKAQERRHKE